MRSWLSLWRRNKSLVLAGNLTPLPRLPSPSICWQNYPHSSYYHMVWCRQWKGNNGLQSRLSRIRVSCESSFVETDRPRQAPIVFLNFHIGSGGPHQPLMRWIPGTKLTGCEVDHSTPSSDEIKNEWISSPAQVPTMWSDKFSGGLNHNLMNQFIFFGLQFSKTPALHENQTELGPHVEGGRIERIHWTRCDHHATEGQSKFVTLYIFLNLSSRSRMVELNLHSPVCLHGTVLNYIIMYKE
jgi:hypothetical protein